MKVVCPSCKDNVPGADIDIVSRTAVCRACGELLPLPHAEDIPPPTPEKPRTLVFEEARSAEGYRAVVALPGRAAGYAILPVVILLGMLAVALGLEIPSLGLLLGVAAMMFLYLALVTLFQKLSITLDRTKLAWKIVPLRIAAERWEATADILRFETVQNQHRWAVRVVMRDGRILPSLAAFADARHAAYIAGRLNDELATASGLTGYRDNARLDAPVALRLRVTPHTSFEASSDDDDDDHDDDTADETGVARRR